MLENLPGRILRNPTGNLLKVVSKEIHHVNKKKQKD
jgi:hypothetical protein